MQRGSSCQELCEARISHVALSILDWQIWYAARSVLFHTMTELSESDALPSTTTGFILISQNGQRTSRHELHEDERADLQSRVEW